MATARATKISISLPAPLAKRLKQAVGDRGVSAFAARAIAHELERQQLGAFLEEMERSGVTASEDLLEEARTAWRKRSSSTRKR